MILARADAYIPPLPGGEQAWPGSHSSCDVFPLPRPPDDATLALDGMPANVLIGQTTARIPLKPPPAWLRGLQRRSAAGVTYGKKTTSVSWHELSGPATRLEAGQTSDEVRPQLAPLGADAYNALPDVG